MGDSSEPLCVCVYRKKVKRGSDGEMAWTRSAMEDGLEEEGTSSMVSEVGFTFCCVGRKGC